MPVSLFRKGRSLPRFACAALFLPCVKRDRQEGAAVPRKCFFLILLVCLLWLLFLVLGLCLRASPGWLARLLGLSLLASRSLSAVRLAPILSPVLRFPPLACFPWLLFGLLVCPGALRLRVVRWLAFVPVSLPAGRLPGLSLVRVRLLFGLRPLPLPASVVPGPVLGRRLRSLPVSVRLWWCGGAVPVRRLCRPGGAVRGFPCPGRLPGFPCLPGVGCSCLAPLRFRFSSGGATGGEC